MSTELLSTPRSIHDCRPRIHPTVGPSHGAAPSPPCRAPGDGSNAGRFAATAASILGQAGHNSVFPVAPVATVAPMSTQGQTNRPRRATSRSGNVAPSVPQPRTCRTFHSFFLLLIRVTVPVVNGLSNMHFPFIQASVVLLRSQLTIVTSFSWAIL